jgi:hypothetical protein
VTRATGRLTVAEVAVLSVAVAVGVLALVSLVAAHLGRHDPPYVFLGTGGLLLGGAWIVVRWSWSPLVFDVQGLAAVCGGVALAAFMFFPGFEYATGDRDPGAYVEHAVAIQRTDGVAFRDDLAEVDLPEGVRIPGWPAMWAKPGEKGLIFPQFYHLWPSLLATSKDVGGFFALFNTGPVLGVVAVALAVSVARRLAGLPAAWTVAALLPTNMLEVWQAKYPSSEIFGQMLFLGVLLGAVLAFTAGSRVAAAGAGFLLGLCYLERADALLAVLMAWGGLCVLIALRKFDARAWFFALAAAAVLPYGLYQAYGLARIYTLANGVPTLPQVGLLMVFPGLLAFGLAHQRTFIDRFLEVINAQATRRRLGHVFLAACVALMVIGALRPKLFGKTYGLVGYGADIRTYDEINLYRLSWFFSEAGLAMMLVGVGYIALRRWRPESWMVLLPTVVLLVIYSWHLRNSPYLMWATRRYVTTVVPGMVILIGCGVALCVLLVRRYASRFVAISVAGVIVAGLGQVGLRQSLPLRSHDENGGSLEVAMKIADLAGNAKGVFLWPNVGGCCKSPSHLFGGPVFAIAGQSSALLPGDVSKAAPLVARYVEHFGGSGRPVFWVTRPQKPLPAVPGVEWKLVLDTEGVLPHWEETYETRPKKRNDYVYEVRAYRASGDAD